MAHEHTVEVHERPDAWHAHERDESPQPEHAARANPALIGVVLAAIVASFVGTVVLTILYFSYAVRMERQAKIETTALAADWSEYHDRTMEEMTTFRWIDPEAGTLAMPIDQASRAVIDRYAQQRGDAEGSGR